MIITSDNEFFQKIGEEETKRYFKESYNFISKYQKLGQENIISAVVHMDEQTPHMHLVFIPVVNSQDKNKNSIRKVSSSEFWHEKNSYNILQDKFYEYIKSKNFNLEIGNKLEDREHITTENLKALTNFYETKQLQSEIKDVKSETVNYTNMKEFCKNESFTMESVDKNLLLPIVQENKSLINQNHKLRIVLSKAKNATKYYKDLENKNKELNHKVRQQEIEINAMYKIIKTLDEKYEELINWIKAKFGIDRKSIEKGEDIK